MTAQVVVVGSVNMDAVARVERLPRRGETVLSHDLRWLPGGKGANQAVAATRMGAPAALVARVGDDDHGRSLQATLAGEGVAVDAVESAAEAATGTALVTVARDGTNTIVVAPLANGLLLPADVDVAAPVIQAAVVLLCQLEVPLPTVVRALEVARAAGATTVLNPSPAQELGGDVVALVDVVVANEHEAEVLGRRRPRRALVVTLGARGALVVEGDRRTELPSYPVEAVDTTGAGDAFAGALAAGLAAGRDVAEATAVAVAAGALAVTHVGALPALPTAAEVAAVMKEAGR